MNIKMIEVEKALRNALCVVCKKYGNENPYIGIDIEEWDDVNYPELFIHCILPEGIDSCEFISAIRDILVKYKVCSEGDVHHLCVSDRFLGENIYSLDFIEQTLAGYTSYTVEKIDEDLWIIDGWYYLIKCN